MSTIFRKLNEKRSWDNGRARWLCPGNVQADALQCLSTRRNKLSVYVLDDGDADTQKQMVVAALALTRNNVGEVSWAIFPEEVLIKLGIRWEDVEGSTPHKEVNSWHRDLIELDALKVAKLAAVIRDEGTIGRSQPNDVKRAILGAISGGDIARDKIDEKLIESLKNKGIIV